MTTILVGMVMIAGTVTIHAIGATRWLGFVGRWHASLDTPEEERHLFTSILSTGSVLLLLHIFETIVWALLYRGLPGEAGLSSFKEAIYFSMVSFTSLGYGDVTLLPEWRLLGPMEAMAGLTVFGITTALLFAVIQRCWKIRHGGRS